MGFLIGFLVGIIVSPLLLALVSKPLMKWFIKRKANKFMSNITDRLSGLQNQFPVTMEDGGKEEDSEIRKD